MTTRNKINSLVLATLVVMSVFAASVAFTGAATAGANVSDHDYDAELTVGSDNGAFWAGQNLLYNGSNANEKLTIYKGVAGDGTSDEFVREVETDANGHYVFDTADLSGDYYFEDSSGTTTQVEVREQTITTTFGEDFVSNGDTGNTVEFDGDSNRATSDVTVSADGLTATQLDAIFANYGGTVQMDSTNDTITLVDYSNDNNNAFNLNFSGVEKGDYTFNFDVADSTASSSTSLTVNDAGEADAQFSNSILSEERGNVVEFTVNVENTNTADVEVGGKDVSYTADLTVTDENDDGEVTVYFNTYTAGDGSGAAFSTDADSDDTVTVNSESTIAVDKLQKASYDLSAFAGGEETDVAVVNLNERSTDGATIHTAPAGASLTSVDQIANATSEDSSIAQGDKVVVQIDVSGLEGSALSSSADLVKGSAFAQSDGAYVTIEQQNPGQNTQPKTLDVSKGTLVQDDENDSYYLVFDSSDLNVEADEEYEATFTLDENSDFVENEDATEEVTDSFNVVEQTVSFDAMTEAEDGTDLLSYELSQDKTVTVSGDSTLAAGSEFTVRVRSDGSSPFLKSQEVTVQDDGSFAATFDMSSVEKGTEFTTEARGLSDRIDSELTVPTASISASDVTVTESTNTVVVDEVYLPYGGFVTIHDASVTEGAVFDSILGTSKYLEPGTHENVEVTLNEPVTESQTLVPMAHQDSNDNKVYDFVTSEGDADGPYTVDGSAVVDTHAVTVEAATYTVTVNVNGADTAEVTLNGETKTAEGGAATFEVENGNYDVSISADGFQDASTSVTVDGADATADVTLEAEQTDQPTTDKPTDNTTEEPPATTEQETPGFGAVVALVALAGAALIARRRD